MRATRNSSELLVLRDIPLGPGLLLLGFALFPMLWGWALWRAGQMTGGMILIAIGLILFFGCFGVFVRILTLRFDRRADRVEITETGIFGRRREEHALRDISGATLQSMVIRRKPGDLSKSVASRRLEPEPRVWRVALVDTDGNARPVTKTYASERSAGLAAAAINGWFGKA